MSSDYSTAIDSPYLVPADGDFKLKKQPTKPDGDDNAGKQANAAALSELVQRFAVQQQLLYADNRRSLLLVFQAMDAAGKDGTIRAVLSGVNPQGCQVFAFKAPSAEELDHDYLWRVQRSLPERGRIGVWNRSHYEEVLTVRVNPQFLAAQRLPYVPDDLEELWQQRYHSIVEAERHWAQNGTVVIKFFLNVSLDEQKERLLARIDEPESNWKFELGDVQARKQWPAYMEAYQAALSSTSRPWAPWYVIPADSKHFMRRTVAEIVVSSLDKLKLRTPEVSDAQREKLAEAKRELLEEA